MTKKGFFQLADLPAGGHLLFLHGFEQSRLGLGGGAVDFVGQHHLRKDRPFLKHLMPAALLGFLDNVGAGNVGGH